MANFPVFHGVTLAANSYIENLHLEVLSSDPLPVGPGRLWFNSTDKVVRFSSLDATGAVVIRTVYDYESAQIALAQVRSDFAAADELERQARIAGDASTLADAKAYTDAAKAEILGGMPPALLDTIAELAAALENNPNIISVLEGMIAAADAAVAAETTRALAAEQALDGRIDDEAAARVASDAELDGRLSSVEGQVNGKIGNLAALTTDAKSDIVSAINEIDAHADAALAQASSTAAALSSEISRAQAAEAALSADIAAETARAQGVEAGLRSDLTDESAARILSDQVNAAAIAAEVSRAQAAEAGLQSDIASAAAAAAAAVLAEENRAKAVEAGLRTDINKEISDRTAAVAAVQASVDAEAARAMAVEAGLAADIAAAGTAATGAAEAAVAAVKSGYNATVYTFQATAAATVHTINHGLNNEFVALEVEVERANGKYYNDIVSVETVDANTKMVYLSQALKVKVIARSAASI